MVATRMTKGKRKARGAVERRSSSRILELVVKHDAVDATPAPAPQPEVEMTDADIEATLRHADALEPEVKTALVALRRHALRPAPFALPFTADEIKSIGQRKIVRHPPPFGHISKSIYLSTTRPVADLPVHKCNCFEDKSGSTSRRGKPALPALPATPERKKRGKKTTAAAAAPPPPPLEMSCGENCHNRMLYICCSADTCSAPDPALCLNRAIKRREYKPVRVEFVGGSGFGLFAEQTIEPGEFIIEYVGEVIDDEECERRLIKYRDQGEEHFYMLEIEKDVVIDARYRSNEARFINHSCDPNSMTQKWNVDGLRRIGIFARRRVLAGEEITIDYNFSHFGDPMDCRCGSVACTGKLGLKRSDVQTRHALQRKSASKKSLEVFDEQPPEVKRPVLLSSLALLKSAKLDAHWLTLYGFKKRRLFVGHKKHKPDAKKPTAATTTATATATATAAAEAEAEEPSVAAVSSVASSSSSSSSPLSSEWSSTTTEEELASMRKALVKSDWYEHVQRGDHLAEMRARPSYICGGKFDWSDDLMDLPPKPKAMAATTATSSKKLVAKRVGLLDARARRFADLLAFANGASAWNARVPSSARIDPDRIYRFIDNMKSGQLFHNQNLNDLNEDTCLRCGLAGELICCDGCPAAFHLNCTNLVMLPPQGDPWFCADCKRSARLRAQVEADAGADAATDGAVGGENGRRNLRGGHAATATTAPVGPSLKRIFHANSTADLAAKRRPRKKMKTASKSYRLLEQMPLPAWDDDE